MIHLVFYHGKSWVSKAIQKFSRSPISHVALVRGDKTIEAWHQPMFEPKWDPRPKGRVTLRTGGLQGMLEAHQPCTPIDMFHLPALENNPEAEEAIWQWALSKVGALYDFRMVGRFVARLGETRGSVERYFCSELVAQALARGGIYLLERKPPWATTPGDLYCSPYIFYTHSFQAVGKEGTNITSWHSPELVAGFNPMK